MQRPYIVTLMILFSLSILTIEAFSSSIFDGHNLNASNHAVLKIEKKINENDNPLNDNLTLGQFKFPVVHDGLSEEHDNASNLVIEKVIGGLRFPTAFVFLSNSDIILLEKDSGQVRRIVNGTMVSEPLMKENVNKKGENGMLGIASSKLEESGKINVFLYFTEALPGTTGFSNTSGLSTNYNGSANRLYRYELAGDALVSPELLLDLPGGASAIHNGGKIVIGPDNNIYVITGDTGDNTRSAGQNAVEQSGLIKSFDGTSSILKISQNGKLVRGIISNDSIGENIYAYGIRNGFGLDFDPITGELWDTENGPAYGDEINYVKPGFNSGWNKVQGVWKHTRDDMLPSNDNITYNPPGLLNFSGTGKYGSPEFTWNKTVGPTAIKFLNSDKLGKEYENDIFVGDINGNLYHFDLNNNRSGLLLNGSLVDKIANSAEEVKSHILLYGLGGITDIQVGPDGYLYFSTLGKPYYEEEISPSSDGALYRVRPLSN
jgi:glucose/arabinose dehydrogenase